MWEKLNNPNLIPWNHTELKLYLITEFQRLKLSEAYRNEIEWHANRILVKANYIVHTDAIKNYIVPEITENQKKLCMQKKQTC